MSAVEEKVKSIVVAQLGVTEDQVAALRPAEPEPIVEPPKEEIVSPEGKAPAPQPEDDGDFS